MDKYEVNGYGWYVGKYECMCGMWVSISALVACGYKCIWGMLVDYEHV